MLFNSAQFLIFFPIVTLIYFVIPHKVRYLWLLVCSYYFYMCWNPAYSLLLLFSTVVTYACALGLEWVRACMECDRAAHGLFAKKLLVGLSVAANLSILAYFKYSNFLIGSLNSVLARWHVAYQAPAVDVLLPVGISFYIFQALGYTVDVYRENIRAEKNFFMYALFVSFFPQLVAGPIERSGHLLAQFREKHSFSLERLRSGFLLMLWGYFLKLVLADRIAVFVDAVYGAYTTYTGWYLIAATVLFAFQIYCDFAGYSTIAKGAAEIMGFSLMENFDAPYFSRSVSEFWRRWHISLSSWFRDYLYIPLGGNKRGQVRKNINLLIVFFVSGLWHGAEWSFVVWGLLNGFYQIAGNALQAVRAYAVRALGLDRKTFSHRLYQSLATFVLIDISWVFFRASNIEEALWILNNMVHASNFHIFFDNSIFSLGLDWKNFMLMILSIVALMAVDFMKCRGICIREVICRQELWFRWCVMIGAVVLVMVFGIWGSGFSEASFIYFQF